MRNLSIISTLCLLTVSGLAHAEPVTPLGWTANGHFVVRSYETLQTCAPRPVAADHLINLCAPCANEAACGLAAKLKPPAPAKQSHDGKVKTTFKQSCQTKGEAACMWTVTLGKLGSYAYGAVPPTAKPKVTTYFRPDSLAVAVIVHLDGDDSWAVIDLTGEAARKARLSDEQVDEVMKKAAPAFAKCGAGQASLVLRVDAAGKVTHAIVQRWAAKGAAAGPPPKTVNGCLTSASWSLPFPAGNGAPITLIRDITLP